jgi:hypothetical protein
MQPTISEWYQTGQRRRKPFYWPGVGKDSTALRRNSGVTNAEVCQLFYGMVLMFIVSSIA